MQKFDPSMLITQLSPRNRGKRDNTGQWIARGGGTPRLP